MYKPLIILTIVCLGLLTEVKCQSLPAGIYKFYAKEYGIQTAGYWILRPDNTSHYWSEDTPNILIEKSEVRYNSDTLILDSNTIIVGDLDGIKVYKDVTQKFLITDRVGEDYIETIKVEEIDNGKVIKLEDPIILVFERICESY